MAFCFIWLEAALASPVNSFSRFLRKGVLSRASVGAGSKGKRMAGAGVPVSMDDGAGIAAAPETVDLPFARSGQKWPEMAPKRKGPARSGAVRCDANALFF